jgi:hypothetical protein
MRFAFLFLDLQLKHCLNHLYKSCLSYSLDQQCSMLVPRFKIKQYRSIPTVFQRTSLVLTVLVKTCLIR